MAKCYPELWNDNGILYAWKSPLVQTILAKAQPPGMWLHSGSSDLVTNTPTIASESRKLAPQREVRVAIAAGSGSSGSLDAWRRVCAMCVQNGITHVQLDIEGKSWESQTDRLASILTTLAREFPTIQFSISTYGQPLFIPNVLPPPTSTGFSTTYGPVLHAMLGIEAPPVAVFEQVYFAETPPEKDWMIGLRSQARSRSNYAVAVAEGYVSPEKSFNIECQLHNSRCDSLCSVAVWSDTETSWWALNGNPAYSDDSGVQALWSCCELERRGYTGPGSIIRFQRDNGLVVDNRVGPATRAALGVSWP